MTDTTTIQVRRDQAERLKELQTPSGNYKTVIDALLAAYEEDDDGDDDLPPVVLDAAEVDRIADEVTRRLEGRR